MVELVLVWKKISDENGQIWPFLHSADTPTPRRRSARLGVELSLGVPEPKFAEYFGFPMRSSAPPRSSIASPKLTYWSCFGYSLPLILTIFHWTNDDPNK